MTLTLTLKEQHMLAAVAQEMGEIPNVDFAKVATVTGQKYGKNARSAFKKVWDKIKDYNAGEGVQGVGSGGDEADIDAPKVKAKAAPRKRVGQRKAPAPAARPSRRSKRPTKKEREAAAAIEAKGAVKANAESDDNADGEDDTTVITAAAGEEYGGSDSEDKAHASHSGSPGVYQENRDNDEISATLLGITVEEFRKGAGDYGNGYAPTPNAYINPDDEV